MHVFCIAPDCASGAIYFEGGLPVKKFDTKRLTILAMLAAIAYVVMVFIRIPAVSFLKYEPKDVILTITGFLFGPFDALVTIVLVALVEMFTVSDTGPIGMLMNVISSASFVCVSAAIYRKHHTLKGALIGLITGVALTTGIMLLWNYLVTPFYQGVPRSVVAGMLVPVFLPFNLVKGTLNAAITMLLYKPVVQTLRKARLVPASSGSSSAHKSGSKVSMLIAIVSSFVVITCVLLFLVMSGTI